jgi:hypothetical protein
MHGLKKVENGNFKKKLIERMKINTIVPIGKENLLPINNAKEIVAAPTKNGRAISDARSSKLPLRVKKAF